MKECGGEIKRNEADVSRLEDEGEDEGVGGQRSAGWFWIQLSLFFLFSTKNKQNPHNSRASSRARALRPAGESLLWIKSLNVFKEFLEKEPSVHRHRGL